ncbi:exodeoxyribonuclease VII large subunit [Clostridium perfringens]|jgi:exodeoxyribonuclease VII large subunit|uniref:Exodeoxyribonuclease 7 large subunit n=1 Tax=Clostridium perfringens TaxID=1502 RepID=A0AAE8K817_CLOPF|nr:exodeoxyribonuclease VII large subunit [Clostridium perfringens]EIF6289487.1 exodeoxyribonuclease VII large subunit [Clostridium perfringens]EJT5929776.1 exodeoxyribonuclease VII large subunit [Clostridium perfringens]EJT6161040.1 exodeoxyribonuclease VII large subunit [Clostridium perfringens]EJT6503521.1 exodeoxyribonuclease VII large subunit [Clostridium perfringens]MCC5432305.1 exodeoxyribonuclease VII large subunit [Clostridium perfringens]
MKLKTLSVGEVNNYVKKLVENDFILKNLNVKGEISNLKFHSSGHIYFSLKDENSKVNCIMFKNNAVNLDFRLEEGMRVEIKARLGVYHKEGTYQLYCENIKKAGIGELFEEFHKLKKELSEEGIFDEKYKRALPKFPKRVGIITARTGAAVRDIIKVIQRRNKSLDIILYPAKVQGENAADSIIEGIRYFNNEKSVDVIILGRGGGSIEELWAFNNRDLAYEIFNSRIPTVSAVGHEVDFTISDFVSDMRAPTPSAAGELVSPSLKEMINDLVNKKEFLHRAIDRKFLNAKKDVDLLHKGLKGNNPKHIIEKRIKEVNSLEEKLNFLGKRKIDKAKDELIALNSILQTLNPLNTLGRGYSVIMDKEDKVINEVSELKKNDMVKVIMKDGSVNIDIKIINE